MELIPILSTIILVATISTFILAIGAYILYKVREAKGIGTQTPKPSEVKGELITPVAAAQQEQFPAYSERTSGFASQRQPIFINQEPKGSQARFTPQAQQYNAEKLSKEELIAEKKHTRSTTSPKFMKFTSEGYLIPHEDNKNTEDLKWK
jgi:hypothetical protein